MGRGQVGSGWFDRGGFDRGEAGPDRDTTGRLVDRPGRDRTGRLPGGMARWLSAGVVRLVAPRQAAAVLVAVAVLAAAVTGLTLYWLRPRAAPIGAPPLVAATVAAPRVERAQGTAATSRSLVLAVVGRVRHPGLVTVPAGARLVDAVRAAGGALPRVDLTSLNLARRVVDGEQIVVGTSPPGSQPGPAGSAGSAGPGAGEAAAGQSAGPLNLNTATLEQLDALPGIGPVIAQRILDWRSGHGGFTSVEQLREVDGIGEVSFGRLRTKVTV
jgi:competence protein ComEA